MRLRLPLRFALAIVLLAMVAAPLAQTSQPTAPPPSQAAPTFETGATAILVDVVVRDRQGNPVTDLAQADFELYEDNVRQEIASLTLVTPERLAASAAATAAGEAVDAATPSDRPRAEATGAAFIALAFDRLTPEARALAHKGATAYLETAQPSDFAGVFLIDQSLNTVQTFTNDREKVRAALADVASTATVARAAGDGRMAPRPQASLGPTTALTAGAEANLIMERMATRMERSYNALMRDQQGRATAASLLALVDALGTLPGRKTVVFFAEGIALPPAVQAQFESIIATANRANVSIYTIDAAGLRVHSKARETADQIQALGARGIGDAMRDDSRPYTEDLELNEDVLREDPAAGLGVLAQRTGGFFINNTNDLQRGFRRIDDDRRFHYLLTYTPRNDDFKGEYRQIAVKVARRNVSVRARSGYVAVRDAGGPILTYEGPMLALLDRTPLPGDIPARGGAFSFPNPKHSQVALLVGTDPGAVTFQTDRKTKTFRTDFTILARVLDPGGEGAYKASQVYRLTGPADKVDDAKRGDVLFFRQPSLAPGTYTLQYIVHDALSEKAGAGAVPFTVFDRPDASLQASSLLLVQRAERVAPSERDDENPLFYGDLLLYPNLGEPLRKSVDQTVSFALTIYALGTGPAPAAALALRKDGTPVGQVPLALPAADGNGRIDVTSQLPLDSFPEGTYTLEVTVTRGSEREVRTTSFTLLE